MRFVVDYIYFGARYYNSDISVWLSVDPMSDKHPDYSPYSYVYNNPLNLVDPWGEDSIQLNRDDRDNARDYYNKKFPKMLNYIYHKKNYYQFNYKWTSLKQNQIPTKY